MFVSANDDRYDKCCETQRMSIIAVVLTKKSCIKSQPSYIPMIIKK